MDTQAGALCAIIEATVWRANRLSGGFNGYTGHQAGIPRC
jgi:hypothetical protein